jgi:hypothetical protein
VDEDPVLSEGCGCAKDIACGCRIDATKRLSLSKLPQPGVGRRCGEAVCWVVPLL